MNGGAPPDEGGSSSSSSGSGTSSSSSEDTGGGSAAPYQSIRSDAQVESPSTEPPADEPVERGLFARLAKTRRGLLTKIQNLFGGKNSIDAASFDQLEEILIGGDIGVSTTQQLMADLQREVESGGQLSEDRLLRQLRIRIEGLLSADAPTDPRIQPKPRDDGPLVVVVVGVNGSGKTTTVAKLANQWKSQGAKVMMAAADTFRAAAVDQLREWSRRIDVPLIAGAPDAKPATVVFEAMVEAKKAGVDVLIIDTAGRLHTKSNLMQELEGVRNAITRHQPSAPHEVLLVVDGSTGQNALSQAREFHAAVPLTGLVVTKLDGTPKGGIVVAIRSELGTPVRYIGVGESKEDLRPFNPTEFAAALCERENSAAITAVGPLPDAPVVH